MLGYFAGPMEMGKSRHMYKILIRGQVWGSSTGSSVHPPLNLESDWLSVGFLQVILTQLPGQEVQFELYDKDLDQDDFLGR